MKPAKTIIRNTRCKDLLVIDQDALFKAEERKCLREQTRLDSLRRELENYEQLDQPAFVSWLYSTFGQELTQLRELRAELARNFSILHAVENEVGSRNTSYKRAYERVARRHAAPTPKAQNQPGRGSHEEHIHDDATGVDDVDDEPRLERDLPGIPKPKPASGNLKDRYRELVRRLHPDLNNKLTPNQRQLWHEVQEAYQDRDLERLEQLATMAGVLDGNPARQSTLSELKKMLRDLKQAFGELAKAIKQARNEPDWQFRQTLKMPPRLAMLRNQMALEIADDLDNVENGLNEFKVLFAGWQRSGEKIRPGQRPGKRQARARARGRGRR